MTPSINHKLIVKYSSSSWDMDVSLGNEEPFEKAKPEGTKLFAYLLHAFLNAGDQFMPYSEIEKAVFKGRVEQNSPFSEAVSTGSNPKTTQAWRKLKEALWKGHKGTVGGKQEFEDTYRLSDGTPLFTIKKTKDNTLLLRLDSPEFVDVTNLAMRSPTDTKSITTGDRISSDLGKSPSRNAIIDVLGPSKPRLMVGREGALADLKAFLDVGPRAVKFDQRHTIKVVRAMAGMGKSTLMAAVYHDADVRQAFPDGVLWASLGQTPSIIQELARWGELLGNNEIGRRQSQEQASSEVRQLLKGKRALLIIDDVWKNEHGQLMAVGCDTCRTIFTTRDKEIARNLSDGAPVMELLRLTDGQAISLMRRLARPVVSAYGGECRELATTLEGLPLAIQVAGRMLYAEYDNGMDVMNLLQELREGNRILDQQAPPDLADLEGEITPTMFLILCKSTDLLDPEARRCFSMLGRIVAAPAPISLDDLARLWRRSPDYSDVLRTLVNRGLVESAGRNLFRVHAILVLHARRLLKA